MAEFSEVMKRWREMCIDNNAGECRNDCPLRDNNVCGYLDTATDEDISDAENIIMGLKSKEGKQE